MSVEQGLRASLVRSTGFFKRELIGVVRQPRLIVTLIVAPFLILLAFGLGYRTQPPPFKTLLVVPGDDSTLMANQNELSESFGRSIEIVDITSDPTGARSRLRSGDVDLLIIGPADPLMSLDEGERADFVIVHSEVDPILRSSISLLAQLSVDELNRRVLEEIVTDAQTQTQETEEPLVELSAGAAGLTEALERGDSIAERRAREELAGELDRLESNSGTSRALYSSVGAALGAGEVDPFQLLRDELDGIDSTPQAAVSARKFEERLSSVEERVRALRATDPGLLVSPFGASVQDIADLPSTPALFYAPGALIVLIQHLALTFAALSLVRERQLGLTEVFQVSPLSPGELLIGRYTAFSTISAAVAAALTGVMIGFGVTMRGSIAYLAITTFLVIGSSIGIGFLLSRVSKTDSQAVQYAMMVLLVSIFFTGLILPIDQLIPPVRVISYLVPATFGIAAFHDVMFRGLPPDPLLLAGLAGYTLVVFAASWLVVRRHVRSAARVPERKRLHPAVG